MDVLFERDWQLLSDFFFLLTDRKQKTDRSADKANTKIFQLSFAFSVEYSLKQTITNY